MASSHLQKRKKQSTAAFAEPSRFPCGRSGSDLRCALGDVGHHPPQPIASRRDDAAQPIRLARCERPDAVGSGAVQSGGGECQASAGHLGITIVQVQSTRHRRGIEPANPAWLERSGGWCGRSGVCCAIAMAIALMCVQLLTTLTPSRRWASQLGLARAPRRHRVGGGAWAQSWRAAACR